MSQAAFSNTGRRRYLLKAALALATRKKYDTAVADFLRWHDENDYFATSWEEMDDLLTEYFHELYESYEGKGKSIAAATLAGVMAMLPSASDKLPTSRRALKGFQKLQPAISYPPLTWPLAVVIGVQLARDGSLRQGVGVVVAFHCLLRVGELVSLRREDFAAKGDPRLADEKQASSLSLRHTKTGPHQSVTVVDPSVVELLKLVASNTNKGDLLFPFSSGDFRRHLKATCGKLGLSDRYVPHSLRHGGATQLFASGVRLEDIMLRGRWAASKSARRYIQFGPSLLQAVAVPELTAEIGRDFAKDLVRSFTLAQKH